MTRNFFILLIETNFKDFKRDIFHLFRKAKNILLLKFSSTKFKKPKIFDKNASPRFTCVRFSIPRNLLSHHKETIFQDFPILQLWALLDHEPLTGSKWTWNELKWTEMFKNSTKPIISQIKNGHTVYIASESWRRQQQSKFCVGLGLKIRIFFAEINNSC